MFGWKRHKVKRLDFIVPGAQKSGTTALHYFLRKHPQIALPDRQEMHFFDDEEIFSRPPVDYELLHRHFPRLGRGLTPGEITPSYLYWKPALQFLGPPTGSAPSAITTNVGRLSFAVPSP